MLIQGWTSHKTRANVESCLFLPEPWIGLNQAWALLGIVFAYILQLFKHCSWIASCIVKYGVYVDGNSFLSYIVQSSSSQTEPVNHNGEKWNLEGNDRQPIHTMFSLHWKKKAQPKRLQGGAVFMSHGAHLGTVLVPLCKVVPKKGWLWLHFLRWSHSSFFLKHDY